jgi:hypothetical protein
MSTAVAEIEAKIRALSLEDKADLIDRDARKRCVLPGARRRRR